MNKEIITLAFKLIVACILVSGLIHDYKILSLFFFISNTYFAVYSYSKQRPIWTFTYLSFAAIFLALLTVEVKSVALILITALNAVVILSNILSWYISNFIVISLHDKGKYSVAFRFAKIALKLSEDIFGKSHQNYATSLNDLGELNYLLGNSTEAEENFQEALILREKLFGKNHLDVSRTLNSLGLISYSRHNYIEAESLFKRALTIREKKLKRNCEELTESLNNLALALYCQYRYYEAEPLFIRAIKIFEDLDNINILNYASCVNNLAELYNSECKFEDAEILYKASLEIREKYLSPNDLDLLNSINNLALVYYSQDKNKEGDLLLDRLIVLSEGTLNEVIEQPEIIPEIASETEEMAEINQTIDFRDPLELLYEPSDEDTKLEHLGYELNKNCPYPIRNKFNE